MSRKRIYLLCTGNSCRSQMAEGWARHLGKDMVEVYSAGIEAHGLNPRAVQVMREVGIDISHQQSKVIDPELLRQADYVITLCGDANDRCPMTPAHVKRLHWGFPDPAKATGTEAEVLDKFREVRDAIGHRIRAFLRDELGRVEPMNPTVRFATKEDLPSILTIYNQGIEDRIATLEQDTKDLSYMKDWFEKHTGRYRVFVAEQDHEVIGWADLHPYTHRCAYAGVGELSVYVHRAWRGKGVGQALLRELEAFARANDFHKLVLATFPFNTAGQALYRKMGFREVGVFQRHGRLDGKWVDVMWMEKLLVDAES